MKKVNIHELSYEEIMALYDEHGSERKAAKALGVPRTNLQRRKAKAYDERFTTQRMSEATRVKPTDSVQRFILSSAQEGTKVHEGFVKNLIELADYWDAKLMISGFTYNKGLFEEHSKDVDHGAYYMPIIRDYIVDGRIVFGDRLAFCGELNILPTAVNPLSGFQTYTGPMSGIVPHPKVHLESIPTQKGEPVKIMQTTGAVTLPNYVQKKAGQKAEHYHEIAALVVEILPDGRHFCRHIHAEADGSFQDLDLFIKNGKITHDNPVLAVTWGDIHREKKDEAINASCWGVDQSPNCEVMIDILRPSYSFVHDIIDFMPRNHHNIKDPHFIFEMHCDGTDTVEDTIDDAANFLMEITRPFCETIVIESNHDLALLRWLKTADYRLDPPNARYFLELQTEIYRQIENGNKGFQVLSWAMQQKVDDMESIHFLKEDESFLIANGIECGMHGHLGANGARGNIQQYSRSGRRSNTAHTHSAAIRDGAWSAGVSGSLEMGYNKGLSSWSHSHIVTYPNGKRAMITQYHDGLWCAEAKLDD